MESDFSLCRVDGEPRLRVRVPDHQYFATLDGHQKEQRDAFTFMTI